MYIYLLVYSFVRSFVRVFIYLHVGSDLVSSKTIRLGATGTCTGIWVICIADQQY